MLKIVVFGASGNVGSHLCRTLSEAPGVSLRLLSSSEWGVAELSRQFPDAEVELTDLADGGKISHSIRGAERVFVMYPDFALDEEASTVAMIEAVRQEASIRQVVRLLGVVPEVEAANIPSAFRQYPAMPCWVHWRGRQLWRDSGLPVTFVNPWAWYMQSLLWLVGRGVVEENVFCLPHDHTLPYIDTRDIADVAAHVLTADTAVFLGEELGLTGHRDDCFSFAQLAQQMSSHLGRDIRYSGDSELFIRLHGEAAVPLLQYVAWERDQDLDYRMHTDTVRELLRRDPRRMEDWIIENRMQLSR
ncbi:SDR family oxidoreductase [Parahaliea mediterranea]|uniref:NmrA family NAD(P)-binding protein n=1 Tax=Parahaliea mediterranea TaxID=651086 RepID=A0A939DG15_9GAMM|nr:NmrA family NAD(P)-binding protein [Parahaliea mediterranea]MBN7797588.1 NmrA family NAD(P)-binding protein [Parahaliea mediterranea]